MYQLRRFHGARFERLNAIIDELDGHITSFINLVGSATLPLPEVCAMESLPGTACRVEGHLDARMFPSTDPLDEAERVIESRSRALFDFDDTYDVSGQPHSATQANHAVIRAILPDPGETVACLATMDGGHISHRFGAPNGTRFLPFPLGADGIDYAALEAQVERDRPALIIAGGTSYPRALDFSRLRTISDRVGAHLHADLAHTAPFVAARVHPPAFPYVDSATIDTNKNLRGPSGGILVYRKTVRQEIRRAIFPILQSSPHPTGLMAKAACLTCWTKHDLETYATRMIRHARLLADTLAGRLGPPFFGGTDTHLLLFDVSAAGLTGREAEDILERSRILVNRNQIPGDTRSPWVGSGIRVASTVPAILEYSDADVVALGEAVAFTLGSPANAPGETIERLLTTYHRPLVNTANGRT